jgi:uncharacterized protein
MAARALHRFYPRLWPGAGTVFLQPPIIKPTIRSAPSASLSTAAPAGTGTSAGPPPLLARLQGDLKAALKAKDAARLSVLRSILAATLNASKTGSPVRTDAQLVALLRRAARASADAVAEFRAAGREDLVDKEEAQIAVLQGYVATSGISTVEGEALRGLVEGVKAELDAEGVVGKQVMGEAMKRVLARLEGKDADKTEITRLVKQVVVGS